MSYHGPYTNRLTNRGHSYRGPRRASARRSGAFIATILAILVVAAALVYDVSRNFTGTAVGQKINSSTPTSIAQ
jgi:hypothetical protein